MSDEPVTSFFTLRIEVLHQILDDIDVAIIIRPVRNVCERLRVAADTYHPHTLDLTSMSKHSFRRLLEIIRLENVAAPTPTAVFGSVSFDLGRSVCFAR